jgi:hypothetical protein
VEADVEQAAHIGTAYSQRPKLVEALHVPLCPWEPKWPFARFVSAIHEIRCPILSGLSMLMLKSIRGCLVPRLHPPRRSAWPPQR